MALNKVKQDHLAALAAFSARMLAERNDSFIGNYEWAGVPSFGATITQEELDAFSLANASSPLAGLSWSDISEVEYLRGQLLMLLDNKFVNLYAVRKSASG